MTHYPRFASAERRLLTFREAPESPLNPTPQHPDHSQEPSVDNRRRQRRRSELQREEERDRNNEHPESILEPQSKIREAPQIASTTRANSQSQAALEALMKSETYAAQRFSSLLGGPNAAGLVNALAREGFHDIRLQYASYGQDVCLARFEATGPASSSRRIMITAAYNGSAIMAQRTFLYIQEERSGGFHRITPNYYSFAQFSQALPSLPVTYLSPMAAKEQQEKQKKLNGS